MCSFVYSPASGTAWPWGLLHSCIAQSSKCKQSPARVSLPSRCPHSMAKYKSTAQQQLSIRQEYAVRDIWTSPSQWQKLAVPGYGPACRSPNQSVGKRNCTLSRSRFPCSPCSNCSLWFQDLQAGCFLSELIVLTCALPCSLRIIPIHLCLSVRLGSPQSLILTPYCTDWSFLFSTPSHSNL